MNLASRPKLTKRSRYFGQELSRLFALRLLIMRRLRWLRRCFSLCMRFIRLRLRWLQRCFSLGMRRLEALPCTT